MSGPDDVPDVPDVPDVAAVPRVPEARPVEQELARTRRQLQLVSGELQSSLEELRSTVEELGTTNDELRAMNDELQVSNQVLRDRQQEIERLNQLMTAVLGSMDSGVALVDDDLQVLAWNRRSEDLWGVRADEVVGEHLMSLDVGLPLEQLGRPIRQHLADPRHPPAILDLRAVDRRGRQVQVSVTISPVHDPGAHTTAAMLSMHAVEGDAGDAGEARDV